MSKRSIGWFPAGCGHASGRRGFALSNVAAGLKAARALSGIALADGRAANAFESLLRAIAIQVAGLDVEPQAVISEEGFTWEDVMFDPDYVLSCLHHAVRRDAA